MEDFIVLPEVEIKNEINTNTNLLIENDSEIYRYSIQKLKDEILAELNTELLTTLW